MITGGGNPVGQNQSTWLDEVRSGALTDERSTTFSLDVGGDIIRTKDRWEIGFCYVVNLLNARSTKVDATEGAGLSSSDAGNDLTDFVEGQGTGNRLNVGKSLGYAQLVLVRSTINRVKHLEVYQATGTYSARQTPFLTVG